MRRVAFAVLSTIAGLVGLLSFKTEATGSTAASSAIVGTTSGSGATSGGTHTGTSATSSGSGSSTAAKSTRHQRAAAKSTTRTVTGTAVDTQYGPVQVRITVRNGAVVTATVTEFPQNDPRSYQINAYAIPNLEKETAGVTSASSVQMVSGATYTSEGYLQSLQSALNRAGL